MTSDCVWAAAAPPKARNASMAAAALALMPGILNTVYQSWESGTQIIWDPCDPGASSTCH